MARFSCKSCGRIFNSNFDNRICPQCQSNAKNEFYKVKQFIRDNRGVNLSDVSDNCGVTVNQIKGWVSDDKLAYSEEKDMSIVNCKECGKIFNYTFGDKICASCKKRMDDDFQKVKRYIRSNKQATIRNVSQECEVSINQLKKWVREERLSFSDGAGVGIDCIGCGKSISTGKYCDECKGKLLKGFEIEKSSTKEKTLSKNKKQDLNNRIRFN